jgi:hypothetical protein
LSDEKNFKQELEELQSVFPFNKYEYIISVLPAKNILSLSDYFDLRNNYIDRNLYLYLFEMAPRTFGGTWGLSHLLSKASKNAEAIFRGKDIDKYAFGVKEARDLRPERPPAFTQKI